MAKRKCTNLQASSQIIKIAGRIIVSGYEDHQAVRTATMNRIRDIVRRLNEGIPLDMVEEKKKDKKIPSKYADDKLADMINKIFEDGKLLEFERDYLIKNLELANKASNLESLHLTPMKHFLEEEPLWNNYLLHIKGIGPVIASKLIARLGYCENFNKISSLWRYCGLHQVCPTCTEKRFNEKSNKDEKFPVCANNQGNCPICGKKGVYPSRTAGVKIDFNPKIKPILWILGDSISKQNSPIFRDIYDREKKKHLAKTFKKGELLIYNKKKKGEEDSKKGAYNEGSTKLTPGHAHARAIRKVGKIFLATYWLAAKEINKQPTTEPYVQAHLKHVDIITPRRVLEANGADASVLTQ